MKETTKMSRVISMIEKIYNSTNTDFWNGELPQVIVTCQSRPGSCGHSSVSRVWRRKEDELFELNIAAEVLDFPIEETIDTVIPEQVHLFCRIHDIKETSRNGGYHNKKFKELAESHGLICIYTGSQYGWSTTAKDNNRLLEYAIEKGYSELQIVRKSFAGIRISATSQQIQQQPVSNPQGEKRPSSTRKLICPGGCGQTVRTTKKVNIICGNCLVPMVEVEK